MKEPKAGQRLPFKRRVMQKTNYNLRLKLLKSGLPRLVVRRGHDNIRLQIVSYEANGDKTLAEEISKNLEKVGWNGHCGNTSAAYLAGFMIGQKALKAGVKAVILDIGLQKSTKGAVIYAAAKGAKDSGVDIALDETIAPDETRIRGEHISEDTVKNFEEVKKKIAEMK